MGEMRTFNLNEYKGKFVKVVPVIRSSWIADPEHEAAFLVGTATNNYTAPMDRNGNIICPLTEEEIAYFESPESGMSYKQGELSPYKREDNYWKTCKIRLGKDTKTLNLGNPKDYIDYKLLLSNKDNIAPDAKEAKRKRTYKYMIVSEDHEISTRLNKQGKLQEAYMFFGKIVDNKQEMLNFLKVYGKKAPLDVTEAWLKDELGKLINNDVDTFLEISKDVDRATRLFILDAVDAGIVIKEGRKYFLQGGEPLALPGQVPLIENAVVFLKAKKNQDIYTDIKARLDNTKE